MLGRLVPDMWVSSKSFAHGSFPRCFGPNENEPIDPSASFKAFLELQDRIEAETGQKMPLDAMVSDLHFRI